MSGDTVKDDPIMRERRRRERAIRKAIKWMKDAETLLDTPGFGLADASDSAMLAAAELERVGIVGPKTRRANKK